MTKAVYVFDPTISDKMSGVRGIGRYLQILKENFGDTWKFTDDIDSVPNDAVFINPFFNVLSPPLTTPEVTKKFAVIHDLIPLKYPDYFPVGLRGKLNIFLNKNALRKYDAIITDSETSKKDIIDILHIDDEKIHVIYPILSQDFNKKISSKKLPDDMKLPSKYCLYVGDATWNKNLVTIVHAIQEINITCVFVGKVFLSHPSGDHPWQKELNQFLKLTKDDKRFIFPGYINDERLNLLYKNARCNILVSRDEGFGFSYLEAANFGTPSVLSDIEVFREVAQDSALYADYDDHSEIANQISEFYFNDKPRNEYGEKARKRVEFFSRKTFVNDFEKALSY